MGYGDLFPISNIERIFGIFNMLAGVAFFSYFTSSFIDIIANYETKLGGDIDKSTDL